MFVYNIFIYLNVLLFLLTGTHLDTDDVYATRVSEILIIYTHTHTHTLSLSHTHTHIEKVVSL